jgi:DNA-binding winged helix-turn-helix (wHTH) protein
VTYRFDRFALDTDTRRLLRDGQELHLSPKAFDLLRLLIEGRARALARSDLHDQLWPETHVEDTNLAGLVVEIRRALGDSPETPRYVRTMHRFGYWFIADISEAAPAMVASPPGAAKPVIRYWLIWDQRQIPLFDGENIIGRAPDAAVWLEAPGVSRHHARIRLEGEQATIEDLGSKNGTYVNDRRVSEPTPVANGDQVRIGSLLFTFKQSSDGTSTATHSSHRRSESRT